MLSYMHDNAFLAFGKVYITQSVSPVISTAGRNLAVSAHKKKARFLVTALLGMTIRSYTRISLALA